MRWMQRSATAALLAQACAWAQSDAVIRIDVNRVQVDAVVTDARGHRVTDLNAGDFEVLQDGRPQTITSVAYIQSAPRAVAGPTSPSTLKASEVNRTIAFVVDDLGLSFEHVARIHNSLKKFVDEEMRPGDLVSIIRTSGGMGALQQFTADRRALDLAIAHIRYTPGAGGFGSGGFERVDIDGVAREEAFFGGTVATLRYVMEGLKDLPGRKSAILFSENMRLQFLGEVTPWALATVRQITDAANRASVVINCIDPRGLPPFSQAPGPVRVARDPGDIYAPQSRFDVVEQRWRQATDSQDGMAFLAAQTGGLFIKNNNFLDQAVRQVVEDLADYYLIAYRPDDGTFGPAFLPAFHNLQVTVKRAGLAVRSRAGFLGQTDEQARQAIESPRTQISRALRSPFNAGKIKVHLTALFHVGADLRPMLDSQLSIDTHDLKFTEEADGTRRSRVEVVAVTYGANGEVEDQISREFDLRLPAGEFSAAMERGALCTVHNPIHKPGGYQVRIAVRDEESGEIGSANQFVEAPDVNGRRLALSSVALGGGEEFAPRTFAPGAKLEYSYEVLRAVHGSGNQAQLSVQARIYREGQMVFEGGTQLLKAGGAGGGRVVNAIGGLTLAKNLDPGEYLLELSVSDLLAGHNVARQTADFQVGDGGRE